jgi:hypothetical protein
VIALREYEAAQAAKVRADDEAWHQKEREREAKSRRERMEHEAKLHRERALVDIERVKARADAARQVAPYVGWGLVLATLTLAAGAVFYYAKSSHGRATVIRAENERNAAAVLLEARNLEEEAESSLLTRQRMAAERLQIEVDSSNRETERLRAEKQREQAAAETNEARQFRVETETALAGTMARSPLTEYQTLKQNRFIYGRENSARRLFVERERLALQFLDRLQDDYVRRKNEVQQSELEAEPKRIKLFTLARLHVGAQSKVLSAPLAYLKKLDK